VKSPDNYFKSFYLLFKVIGEFYRLKKLNAVADWRVFVDGLPTYPAESKSLNSVQG